MILSGKCCGGGGLVESWEKRRRRLFGGIEVRLLENLIRMLSTENKFEVFRNNSDLFHCLLAIRNATTLMIQ